MTPAAEPAAPAPEKLDHVSLVPMPVAALFLCGISVSSWLAVVVVAVSLLVEPVILMEAVTLRSERV